MTDTVGDWHSEMLVYTRSSVREVQTLLLCRQKNSLQFVIEINCNESFCYSRQNTCLGHSLVALKSDHIIRTGYSSPSSLSYDYSS